VISLGFIASVVIELCQSTAQVVMWLWRHPRVAGVLALVVVLMVLVGVGAAFELLSYVPLVLVVWFFAHRSSWDRAMGRFVSRWRCWRTYGRYWETAMRAQRLHKVIDNRPDGIPEIAGFKQDGFGDTLWVHVLYGQTVETYQERAAELAKAFGARECRAFDDEKGRVRLEFVRGADLLEEEISALPIPSTSSDVDFAAVPVGVTERGEPWTIDLAQNLHILIGGQTGSGKSGVLQSLIRSLAPAIRDGSVIIWLFDPKEGLEFGALEELAARYEDGDHEAMAEMLGDAVTMMRKQMRKLRATGLRKHVPTPEMPLVLIVIDEFIDLANPKGKKKETAASIAASIGHLLWKGRAGGVLVIASVADPRVESSGGWRDSFPVKIGMRLDTPDHTAMIMGDGARALGALCDKIPLRLPGVGFVRVQGELPVRVRAAFVRDEDIAAMVNDYAPSKESERTHA
jgi:S-DNA-T family DNA segregation ATPase FtsK/SpoIIIE